MNEVTDGKHRRLNKEQQAVLRWLLRYRFSTSAQLATLLNKPSPKAIHAKLQILEAQGFIGKRYDKSYRLAGRGAAYYLTPAGARALMTSQPDTTIHPAHLKILYKNKLVSSAFCMHCTAIVTVVLKLQALHGTRLNIQSAAELRGYSYFPDWTPDLYLRYTMSTGEVRHAFLDIWEGSKPFFVSVRKMRSHLTYADDGDWPHKTADYPALLAICATPHDQKKLNRQMKKALSDSDDADDTPCGTTTFEQLEQSTKPTEKIWASISWAGDTEPMTLLQTIRKS